MCELDVAKKTINVGIILNASDFTTGSSKDFLISDASNKKLKFTKGDVKIFCFKKGIRFEKHILSPPLRIEPLNGTIFANSKPYRGYLIVKKTRDKMNVINVIPIEDYLKGVLPKEVGACWGIEALKTQAVISRTYSISNLNKHCDTSDSDQGFDVCSTTHCQVYGGAEVEVDSCNKAILETQCEVLVYDGKLAQTVFHANCGGHTENPKYIWNWEYTPPYLKGVRCGYCYDSPYTKWESSIDETIIRKKLQNNNIEKIKNIKIKNKTSTGVAKELKISHSNGEFLINAYRFRLAVDAWRIKSHNFNLIKTDGDKFYFKGQGWGHKVGLCQWGTKNMADKGKTYKQILSYYYPGTKVERITYE
ncbi:MAG: SpoIID/LytB domain-containing protein [Endomicrobium sp.]|jgi:stage II sporulation protein D|nr:SpoIID/LytB domain-containing protein [Endomicrobium sp.]